MTTTLSSLRRVSMTRHDEDRAVILHFETPLPPDKREALVTQLNHINFVEDVKNGEGTLTVELTSFNEAQRLASFMKRRGFAVRVPLGELVRS